MTAAIRNPMLTFLFSLSLFLSAGLMFSVQPMVGKMLLPVVGGTPAGWIVAMAFFQLALLAGYAVAYGMARLTPLTHGIAYVMLLAVSFLLLPIGISASSTADTLGASGTFWLLASNIGLPFMALATTATTLQRLFGATDHPHAQDPYFLYAASNLGSFAGLLLYPLLIEPSFTLGTQNQGWLLFYGALIVLAAICVSALAKKNLTIKTSSPVTNASSGLDLRRCTAWVAWAFIPASLLMGYTGFITRDIYSAPLIWVLPLGIYLLTFVVAFRSQAATTSARLRLPALIAVMVTLVLIIFANSLFRTSLLPVALHLLALGIIALRFHLRLYEDRPLGSARNLAAFYLLISLGGALAGIFNAFVAPVVFNQTLELPLVLLASLLFYPAAPRTFMFYMSMALLLALGASYIWSVLYAPENVLALMMLSILALVFAVGHPRGLLLSGIVLTALFIHHSSEGIITRSRNFYGTILVYDKPAQVKLPDGKELTVRYINHGTTLHGFQVLESSNTLQPTSYYGAVKGVYELIQPRRTAVLGLGAGTMHCLAGPDTQTTFVEIDPAVIDAAETYFTFLKDCQPGNPPRILLGDGRLEMQKLGDETFDIISIDVFSSDYIPAHLMTREALALYLDRLAPAGVLLFHISNNFFDLAPVLEELAKDAGLEYRLLENMQTTSLFEKPSRWFMMGRTAAPLAAISANDERWMTPPPHDAVRMWTDDYTDYMAILRPDVFSLKTIFKKKQ